MTAWWESLNEAGRVFACIALPSTLVLIIQIILSIIGFDGDGDVPDAASDVDPDINDFAYDDGLRLFTVRGIISFFAIGGWVGLTLSKTTLNTALVVLISLGAGFLAMYLIALLFKAAMKLQSDGTLDIKNAVGKTGTVYLTVPPHRSGKGKVNITLQERYTELEAVTDENEPLLYGESVTVVTVLDENTILVRKT